MNEEPKAKKSEKFGRIVRRWMVGLGFNFNCLANLSLLLGLAGSVAEHEEGRSGVDSSRLKFGAKMSVCESSSLKIKPRDGL